MTVNDFSILSELVVIIGKTVILNILPCVDFIDWFNHTNELFNVEVKLFQILTSFSNRPVETSPE